MTLHLLTPETETTTHYFWAHSRNYSLASEETDEFTLAAMALTLGEDKDLLEVQQRAWCTSQAQYCRILALGLTRRRCGRAALLQRLIEEEERNPRAVAPPIPLAPDGPLSQQGSALTAAGV